jgi:hypothetical protein
VSSVSALSEKKKNTGANRRTETKSGTESAQATTNNAAQTTSSTLLHRRHLPHLGREGATRSGEDRRDISGCQGSRKGLVLSWLLLGWLLGGPATLPAWMQPTLLAITVGTKAMSRRTVRRKLSV